MDEKLQEVDINTNAQVKVLLTDYGKLIYKKYYEDLNCLKHMPNPNEELKMSLWELAQIFGPVLYMGNINNPFVDNSIKMDFNLNSENEIISHLN